jgi:tetratricopeptide (TPR) repeat protein
MGRRLADPATLAYVLSARNLATLGSDTAKEGLAITAEMLELARALGDRQVEAHALRHRLWSSCDLDDMPTATVDLDRWTALVNELKDPVARGVSGSLRGGLAMMEGRFEDAEVLLREAFRCGQEVRDPNAFVGFGMPMGFLRMLQGRAEEIVSPMVVAADMYPSMRGWADAIVAGAFTELGLHAEAKVRLRRIDLTDAAVLPRNVLWLLALGMVSRACYRLEDCDSAETVYRLLLPYADRNAMAATVGIGSVYGPLGLAAVATGRLDEAERHFELAIAANAKNGWRPWVAETQVFYAALLVERGRDGDHQRALALIDDALATAGELGMATVIKDGRALRERLLGGSGHAGRAGGRQRPLVTRRDRARAKLTARSRAAVAYWTRHDLDDELVRRFGSDRAQRTLFTAMARSFQPAMAFGFSGDLVFELRPPDDELNPGAADWWTVEVRGRRATARRGRSDHAAVTLHAGLADFVRIASGEIHPVQALVKSSIEVEGDLLLAARLLDMFGAVAPIEGLASTGSA